MQTNQTQGSFAGAVEPRHPSVLKMRLAHSLSATGIFSIMNMPNKHCLSCWMPAPAQPAASMLLNT